MNLSMFRSVQGAIRCLVNRITVPKTLQIVEGRGIHQICSHYSSALTTISSHNLLKPVSFLTPILPQFMQVCGMKQKGRLQLRCEGCYYVSRQGRLYVMCKLKPRHKQMQMIKSFKKTRILTFAQQKKVREW
ncbi:uncharacterized protein LOC100114144 [Nasonia vitripennis]|uniref:Ribosomal protein n=1 Tax=Nasonia vitripennis TaxID=7425 RepID=A0A7M7G4Q3_NASVI|nr:uncharacterized protein LOC100114144 [Nasonia vitripennis]